MKKICSLLFLPVFFLAACDDSSRPSGDDLREGAGEAVRAPGDYVGSTLRAQQHAQVQTATQSVTQAVRHFQASEGRFPRNLDELVQQDYLPQLPELPDGVSYEYDPQTGQVGVSGS